MVKVSIRSLSNEGTGIGRLPSGKKCFVEGALPKEIVEVEITGDKKGYSTATAVSYCTLSPDRVKDPEVPSVPGAVLSHLSYEGQLDYKYSKVKESLILFKIIKMERYDYEQD